MWKGRRSEELITILEELPEEIMDLYEAIVCKIEEKGYLKDAALWLETLTGSFVQESEMNIRVIDFCFIDDSRKTALNTTEGAMIESHAIAEGKRMKRKLQECCRDLIQVNSLAQDRRHARAYHCNKFSNKDMGISHVGSDK